MTEPRAISEIDQADFFAAMSHDDPLAVVIKAAIYLENQLIGLVEDCVASPDQLKQIELTYADRVHLAAALGLRSTLVTPLLALGNIRNKFAHRLNATFAKSEADNFFQAFSSQDRKRIEELYADTRNKLDPQKPAKFHSLAPLDRLVLCAVALRGILIVARSQARKTWERQS